MRIAIYHPWVYLKSGLERTILELVLRSEHDCVVFSSHYDADNTYPELKDCDVREVNRVSVDRQYGAVLGAAGTIATTKIDLKDFDALVVCCDGLGSFVTLRNASVPIINLCFTPLRAVYDEEYRVRHLKRHAGLKPVALLLEYGYRLLDRILWRRYDEVICISETVRERVTRAKLYPDERIQICYPGIDEAALEESGESEPFLFLPGRIMWTKNIELGIEGFKQYYQHNNHAFRLVIAGMVDDKSQEYFSRLQSLAADCEGIEFCINPDDSEMRDYYRRCYATIFTAFNEDLGLTPMEAMSHGKPVIAVSRGGPREVVKHQETGYLVPADESSFALAIQTLIENPERAREMGAAGLKRVEQFTWKAFVESFDAVLDGVGSEKSQQ